MMSDGFEFTWQVEDGHLEKSRPHHCSIDVSAIKGGMSDGQLIELLNNSVREDFERKVGIVWEDSEEQKFLEWAKGVQASKKAGA